MICTVCARFAGYPSDYEKTHDWNDLSFDYEAATVMNDIDQKKHEAELKAMFGKK